MNEQHNITRRRALWLGGAGGAAYLLLPTGASPAAPAEAVAAETCARLTPELTQGPYWVNTLLRRANVRANAHGGGHQAGVPLSLYINVVDSSRGCRPRNGLAVDIWHANAHGLYSDESSQQAGGGTSSASGDTLADNWLRGYQVTGRDRGIRRRPVAGQVSFRTIWPGWYSGRAIHIHVRVRKLSQTGATVAGFTTQIFFSDAANDHVLANAAPYNARSPRTDPTTDESDTVLSGADDATNVVAAHGSTPRGYRATFNIALDDAELA
jgi:protocatechuate 3,4-dioxygenase beta subunit